MNIGFSPLSPSAVIVSWCVLFIYLFFSSGFDKVKRIVTRVTQTCQLSESLVVILGERAQKALANTHTLSEWIFFFSCNCFALKNWRSYEQGSHLVILAIHLGLIWKLTAEQKEPWIWCILWFWYCSFFWSLAGIKKELCAQQILETPGKWLIFPLLNFHIWIFQMLFLCPLRWLYVFILYSANVMYHICWFAYTESFLQPSNS